jgi:hypothetical protein
MNLEAHLAKLREANPDQTDPLAAVVQGSLQAALHARNGAELEAEKSWMGALSALAAMPVSREAGVAGAAYAGSFLACKRKNLAQNAILDQVTRLVRDGSDSGAGLMEAIHETVSFAVSSVSPLLGSQILRAVRDHAAIPPDSELDSWWSDLVTGYSLDPSAFGDRFADAGSSASRTRSELEGKVRWPGIVTWLE